MSEANVISENIDLFKYSAFIEIIGDPTVKVLGFGFVLWVITVFLLYPCVVTLSHASLMVTD